MIQWFADPQLNIYCINTETKKKIYMPKEELDKIVPHEKNKGNDVKNSFGEYVSRKNWNLFKKKRKEIEDKLKT